MSRANTTETVYKLVLSAQSITNPQVFASCRDWPSYLALTGTARDLLLPAETGVHDKWLPVETVRVKQTHATVSARTCYLFSRTVVFGENKRSRTISVEAKYDRQEAKNGKLVYTMWSS